MIKLYHFDELNICGGCAKRSLTLRQRSKKAFPNGKAFCMD